MKYINNFMYSQIDIEIEFVTVTNLDKLLTICNN